MSNIKNIIHTDVVININNIPFITLTESKIENVWYHDKIDSLFILTQQGFKRIKGSKCTLLKKDLIKKNYTHESPK